MGIAYRCDATAGCTFIVWDGDVTADDWRHKERELFADPAFPPGPRALADLRSAGGAPAIPLDVVDEMAANLRERSPEIGDLQFAIVPNSGWDKALEFEKQLQGSAITLIVFNSIATACIWLGLDATDTLAQLDELRAGLRG